MFRVMRSWPITLVGLVTIGLFLIAEAVRRAGMSGAGVEALYAVVRVLIIPIWVMRYVVVAIGGVLFGFEGSGFPVWYDIITLPILLLPHAAADFILVRAWRRAKSQDAPAL